MANVKLVFYNSKEEHGAELTCYANIHNEIFIEIINRDLDDHYNSQHICLDKATAIKLSKTLKTAINEIE